MPTKRTPKPTTDEPQLPQPERTAIPPEEAEPAPERRDDPPPAPASKRRRSKKGTR